jgi:UDP-hydrolysing UDP-N-acetyl-D-glucosamine 2-epimerase
MRIGVVTTSRADYSLYRPLLSEIQGDPSLQLMLFVGGMHLAPQFGNTVGEIERDGFPIAERVNLLLASDSQEAVTISIGLGVIGFAQAFARSRPDILVVLGDRFEMFAAVVAAVPQGIPVAHLNGGEVTEGALDEAYRHSITKLSHLHFPSIPEYARRIEQLGEEPWRITVAGALSLDSIRQVESLSKRDLEERFTLDLSEPPLLVTFHPATQEPLGTGAQIGELLNALTEVRHPIIFTLPNADAGGRAINDAVREFASCHSRVRVVPSFGAAAYYSILRMAAALVGNSSSGIVEAISFELPVVDIGTRQKGRPAPRNVIHADCRRDDIARQIDRALQPEFRRLLAGVSNPFGDGHSAERILNVLRRLDDRTQLLVKRFVDVAPAGVPT